MKPDDAPQGGVAQSISMKQLLESGVHFGHQSRRWNPKMKPFIYTERNGIYIIDLKKTLKMMREACQFVRDQVAEGRTLMFVGTKKQAKDSIREAANRCGMFYVNNRWLGGMLTNYRTVRQRVLHLLELDRQVEDGTIAQYSKKEQSRILKRRAALEKNLAGVKMMDRLPDMIFIIDPHREAIAVREAVKCRIPIVAIVDTNCDPDPIDWVIPGNDDAIRAIRLVSDKMSEAAIEGQMIRQESVGYGQIREQHAPVPQAQEETEQAAPQPPSDEGIVGDLAARLARYQAEVSGTPLPEKLKATPAAPPAAPPAAAPPAAAPPAAAPAAPAVPAPQESPQPPVPQPDPTV
jgi:small subunit ribosomal protein S2